MPDGRESAFKTFKPTISEADSDSFPIANVRDRACLGYCRRIRTLDPPAAAAVDYGGRSRKFVKVPLADRILRIETMKPASIKSGTVGVGTHDSWVLGSSFLRERKIAQRSTIT